MANDKWSGSNPWLGLAPYTEGTPLYGRTRESAQLSDIIKDNMASVVFGKSGIGKSSLLSAGISPLLREENYIPVRIRLVHNTDTSYVEQIENTVRETVNCHDRLPSNVDGLGLWDFFHRHTFTTDDGEDCVPVVILDQFEEIYTLTDADHKKDTISFFIELSALLNDIKPDNVIEEERRHSNMQSSPVATPAKRGIIKRTSASSLNYTSATTFRFVVCLREDKLYLLERSSANIPSLKANRYNLQALSPESALEVIMCPRPDLFSNEEATAIIDKLADMGDEGVRTVDPAILSLFLYKYYEKQGQANYDNIFADYYQEATKDINGKSIAFLENHLLTLGGYRNQVPLDDALSSGVTQSEIDSLLNQIILRTEKRKGIDYIEFSHDRLCAEAKKNREERNMREQARKVRRRLLLSFFIFALSAAMLSVVLVLFFKWQSSEEGRLSAEEGQQTAEARTREEKRQKDALALLNAENKRQKDSLALLNGKNLAQKQEIERQRDELQAKNKTLTAQQQEIERKNDELQNMNKELQSKNKDLSAKVTTIEEQRRIIERLQLGSAKNLTVRNKEAGKLSESEVLPYNALANLDSLTISGFLNGTDIKYLRKNGQKLKYLNLYDVTIVEGGEAYSGKIITKDDVITQNNVIGEHMFSSLRSIKEIILPRDVTSIEESAFYGCYDLTSINIPNNVTSIGKEAFRGCSDLTSINIPNNVTSIGEHAFNGCSNLTSINIPSSVTYIGNYAFSGCRNLASINIPNSVTFIGRWAFEKCGNLTSITIPSSVRTIGYNAFSGCVFSNFTNNSSCSHDALWGAKLSDLETKEGLAINNKSVVYYRGKSDSLTIPEGVTTIGGHAFENCTWLTSVTIPNGVTSIDNYAFSGCRNLASINIPSSVTSIGENAFWECSNLTSINLPSSVTTIGSYAFSGCRNLTSITIPNSVKSIGHETFRGCNNLTSITIPNNVTTIDRYMFSNCNVLSSINIPSSVTSIGEAAFSNCRNLTNVTIPNNVTSIGDYAFSYCHNLTSINIPNSVITIGKDCFYDCENLAYIKSGIVDIDSVKIEIENEKATTFNNILYNCTWYVPKGTMEKYTSRPWWVPSWQIIEDSDMGKEIKASYKDGVLNVNGVQYNLLPVEGGTFMMGAIDRPEYKVTWEDGTIFDFGENARPVHEVTLSSYRIGETEITQALWTAVMGYNPSEQKGDNLPVENLSWNDCQSFILKLNALTGMIFRLPTEAEWEFAARGGNKSKNTLFSGSNNLNEVAWFEDNSNDKIHPVKQKRPNELGIYDMCGNVWEWCHDWYGNYQDKHVTNPTGPYNAKERIIRGSNYNSGMVLAYLPIRVTGDPQDKNGGFRLVLSE